MNRTDPQRREIWEINEGRLAEASESALTLAHSVVLMSALFSPVLKDMFICFILLDDAKPSLEALIFNAQAILAFQALRALAQLFISKFPLRQRSLS